MQEGLLVYGSQDGARTLLLIPATPAPTLKSATHAVATPHAVAAALAVAPAGKKVGIFLLHLDALLNALLIQLSL